MKVTTWGCAGVQLKVFGPSGPVLGWARLAELAGLLERLQFSALLPTPYWEFQDAGRPRQVRVHGTFASNHGASVIEAARSGLGVIAALSYQVQDLVAAGALRVVLQRYEPAPIPVNALLPSGRLQPARVRALTDLLQERLAAKDLAQTRPASQLVAERSMRRRGSTA